jgi:YVTN family beta-propeller protein
MIVPMRAVVGVGLLLAGTLAGGCSTRSPEPAAAAATVATAPPAPATVPPRREVPLPEVEQLPSTLVPVTAEAPAALVASGTQLWVQSHRSTVLTRIDVATNRVTAEVRVGKLGCGDLAIGAGAVWQTGCAVSPGLVRVDTTTGEVGEALVNGIGPAVLDGRVWVGSDDAGAVNQVHRFDAETLEEGPPLSVPGLSDGDGGTVAAAGSIWTTGRYGAVVHRIDPATGRVTAAIPLRTSANSGYLVVVDDVPVFTDPWSGILAPIDPATNTGRILSVRTDKPSRYWGVAASDASGPPGRVWVRNGEDEVWLVDTAADAVLRRLRVDVGRGGDVQQVGDVLWVSSFMNDAVERIPLGRGD